MGIGRVGREQNLLDPGDLRRGLGHAARLVASGDQRVDRAELRGGGNGRKRCVLERARFVFDQHQRGHATAPSSLSFATSSSTEPTLIPACRTGGSATLSTLSRGTTSTP